MKTFANLFGTDLVANDYRVFDWINVGYNVTVARCISLSFCFADVMYT